MAFADLRQHIRGITFNRPAGRITGLSPARLGFLNAALPALNVPAQLTALECWLMCNPAPDDLEHFTMERLTTNHRQAAV